MVPYQRFSLLRLISKTWVGEKGWNYVKGKLPDSHRWYSKNAMKKKVKSKASGGMLIGINKNWEYEEWETIGIKREYNAYKGEREGRGAKYSNCI